MNHSSLPEVVLAVVLAVVVGVAAFWLILKLFQGLHWAASTTVNGVATGIGWCGRGVGRLCTHTGRFVGNSVQDSLRLVGGLITAVLILPLALLNVLIGRWGASRRLASAFGRELRGSGLAVYRLGIGNPVRFLGLGVLTDGIERRLPAALDQEPVPMPAVAVAEDPLDFEGYTVVDELPRGGSGAHLYVAEPDEERQAAFAAAGRPWEARVVLKSFSLDSGSTLPQIVRESRALEAARELGLVLDHHLTPERFYYAMPYVPGEDLGVLTTRLHEESEADGLDDSALREALLYVCHLLETLDRFHAIGLWHKDIKPSNVIVSDHRAHLVDLGLVTPLRSAMTLTTHGTEYYRDPEMVRQAMKGAKVHEIDGVKFDLYSLGALLYSLVENTIPAHGSLSQINKRCPESVRWIVRRAMADVNKRYGSAREMLADVRAVLAARDCFTVLPAALPSVSGRRVALPPPLPAERGYDLLRKACAAPSEPPPPRVEDFQSDEVEAAAPRRRKRRGARLALAAVVLMAGFVSMAMVAFLGSSASSYSPSYVSVTAVQAPTDPAVAAPSRQLSPNEEWVRRRDEQASRSAAPAAADVALSRELALQFERVLGQSGQYWFEKLNRLETVLDQRAPRDGRVELLLLPAMGAGIDEDYLQELRDTLNQAQFRVLDTDSALGFELETRVRSLVGVRDVQDNVAAEELCALVRGESPRLDAILWLGRHPSDPDKLAYRMLTASGESDMDIGTNSVVPMHTAAH